MADAARFCSGPLRPPNQCLPLAKASCFNRPPLLLVGAKVPNGSGSAVVVEFGGRESCTVLLRAVTFTQPMPAACQSSLLHPSTFAFRGFEGAKRSGNPVGVNLAGVSCFGCVLTGDAGGCDVPLERLMPHGAAQGRDVRPTNACCLPKLPASPVHLCF